MAAGHHVRRLYNQAFFEKIFVEEDNVHAELAEPFRTLLGGAIAQIAADDQRLAVDGVELMDMIRASSGSGVDGHVIPPGLLSRNSATGGPRLQGYRVLAAGCGGVYVVAMPGRLRGR